MARSPFSGFVRDRAGNVIANAKVNVFLAGTSTPISDMYAGAAGGSPVAFFVSDSTGYYQQWIDTPKSVKVTVTSNGGTAFLAGDPSSLVSFSDVTYDNVPLYENPADGEADDATLDGLVTAVTANTTAINNLKLSGTFSARPAAGTADRIYFATDQGIHYRDTGTVWQRMLGDPNEIWVTDYGATPTAAYASPSGAIMTANVAAFDSAIAAARASLNSSTPPFKGAEVIVPGIIAGWRYWVNSPINFEAVQIRGVGGSVRGPGGEANNKVWIDGSNIASGRGTFELDNIGVVTAGVAANGSLVNLYIVGVTNCVRNVGRAFMMIRDCDMYSLDTSHADRACIYMENAFWQRIERCGLTCAAGAVSGGSERCVLMVCGEPTVGDVQGISQTHFRNIVMNFGQVRFEHRKSTGVQGGDSANVGFHDVLSENVGTQPFLNYVRTTGSPTIAHDLNIWSFTHVERADATTAGASFLSMDYGTNSGAHSASYMKMVTIHSCNPYSQYWLRAVQRGGFANVHIFGKLIGTSLMSSDSDFIVTSVKESSENGFGIYTSQLAAYNASPNVATWFLRGYTDTQPGWMVDLAKTMWWGAGGSTAPDTNLYRSAANTLKTDDSLVVGANLTVTNGLVASDSAAMRPTGYKAETMRRQGLTNFAATQNGKEVVSAIYLQAGTVVSTVSLWAGSTALSGGTNQWFTLRDANLNLLRVTNDDTSTAWAIGTEKTLTLSSSYTVTTSGLFYVGVMVAASTTVPSLVCDGNAVPSQGLMNKAPALCGFDNTHTGLTNPASAPATLTLNAGVPQRFYAGVN